MLDDGAEIAAYGRLLHGPSDSLHAPVFMLGAVDPVHRRRGVGSAILGWQLARANEILAARPAELHGFIRTQAYDFERDAIALYERHGLVRVRYVDELMRPLDAIEPVPAQDGISLARWDPARSEERRAVYNEGFSDQWGATPLDRDAWDHRLAAAGMRFDLSFMALRGVAVVALALNGYFPDDEAVTGRRDGWIRNLATRRAGLGHAMLSVDSDNPSGAYQLYERIGFRRLHRSIQHQVEVSSPSHPSRV